MGRIVYCPLADLTVSTGADQDIWEMATGSDNKVKLLGWEVTSAATTAEALQLRLIRGTGSGTGGGPATEATADPDDTAITVVVETLNTSPGTDGILLQTFRWEQLGPLGHVYTPEMQPTIDVSSYLKLNLVTALGAETHWDGWICWEEL